MEEKLGWVEKITGPGVRSITIVSAPTSPPSSVPTAHRVALTLAAPHDGAGIASVEVRPRCVLC